MRRKVIFNHFNRLGKLLFFHMLKSESFEVVAIISPFSAKELLPFLSLDSTHGKFWGQVSKKQKDGEGTKITFTFANQQEFTCYLYDSKKLLPKTLKKLNADIVINLDETLKPKKLLEWRKYANRYVISELGEAKISKQGIEPIVFGVNHTKILKERSKLVYISSIEATIILNLLHKFRRKIKIDTCQFLVWKGPNNDHVFLDEMSKKGKNGIFARSALNNILTAESNNLLTNLEVIRAKNRYDSADPIIFRGQKMIVPIRGSALLTINLSMHEIHDQKELTTLMQESSDSLIAFYEAGKNLTAQDVVSTNHFAVLDQNLVKFLMTNQNKLMSMGLWYDPESSHAISIIKTMEFLAN